MTAVVVASTASLSNEPVNDRVVTRAMRWMFKRESSAFSCAMEPDPQWMTRGFE